MQFINSYFQIDFTGSGGSFSILVSDPGGSFEGSYGDNWMNDLADRISASDWAVNGHGGGTVSAITYFGQGRSVTVT
jgi:hypothetical protein